MLEELTKKSRDKTSPARDKTSPNPGSRDKTSPMEWGDPWKINSEHVDNWAKLEKCLKPASGFANFQARYIPRPRGPVKAVQDVINYLMSFPENHNFYLKSQRCYVHVQDNQWKQIPPKVFFPQLRAKILVHYKTIVFRAHSDPTMKSYAIRQLEKASLDSWTNKQLACFFAQWGEASFDQREKTRTR